MAFYTYIQNNSDGEFVYNEKAGIAQYVIIEAGSSDEADYRAERIGLYFYGVYNGRDCSCCGDRWYTTSDFSAYSVPSLYGREVRPNMTYDEVEPGSYGLRFTADHEATVFIHHADGRIESAGRGPATKKVSKGQVDKLGEVLRSVLCDTESYLSTDSWGALEEALNELDEAAGEV